MAYPNDKSQLVFIAKLTIFIKNHMFLYKYMHKTVLHEMHLTYIKVNLFNLLIKKFISVFELVELKTSTYFTNDLMISHVRQWRLAQKKATKDVYYISMYQCQGYTFECYDEEQKQNMDPILDRRYMYIINTCYIPVLRFDRILESELFKIVKPHCNNV